MSNRFALAALMLTLLAAGACSSEPAAPAKSTTPETASEAGATAVVEIKNLAFNPVAITVKAGQTVEWRWADGEVAHNVDFGDFKTETQATGTFLRHYAKAGTFQYKCDVHPDMKATVVVTP